jgi:ATP-independent RNA helicase DbpA
LNQSHSFATLNLHPDLLRNLESLGYRQPTEIQAQSLAPILAGQDVMAQGKTGSGKTAAFGLGVLQKIEAKKFTIRAMLLCPTRELADQVADEIRRLARRLPNIKVLTLCGGMNMGAQLSSLQQGAHIIVGTPGRINCQQPTHR